MAAFDILTFNGTTLSTGNIQAWLDQRDPYVASATLETRARRSLAPTVDGYALDGTQRIIRVSQRGSAVTADVFRRAVEQLFDPSGNGSLRYLTFTAGDGTTTLRLGVYIVRREWLPLGVDQYIIELLAPAGGSEANADTTSSSNPATVTNAGTRPASPILALTSATHGTLRATTVAGTGNGGGLTNYPTVAALNDANATATNVWVFIRGVPVPCLVDDGGTVTSRVWFLCDTKSDGADIDVAIIYASGITNPRCGALSDGGMLWTGTGESDNSTWRWDDWQSTSHPNRTGVWVPSVAGRHAASTMSFGITAEATGGITFSLIDQAGAYPNDADSLTLAVGAKAGATSALTNLKRALTGASTASDQQAYVRYRKANSTAWTTAWTQATTATVTTSIDLDDAVEIIIGLEFLAPDPGGSLVTNPSLTIASSGTGASNAGLSLAATPTVTVGAAATVDVYNGSYTIGSRSLTFDAVFVPDGTFTIDCATGEMTSSTGQRWYGDIVPSDPDVLLALESGDNTITDGLGATDVITHRGAFA